ncbi:MAG: HlyC/CorC family transporter [Anaerolineae bacterium]|nr:HlyC/CorC family transporter [Anaerolineae bacterium]MBT4312006.1 HlyC/CorC family transporter [Anaerolineae bacterium]MBT4458154.1 HlyC/CorC family transporter [Anaerolineae bacterium]MBT4841909.1 HlyC/CorC family transporter [Anaerolineae bacterium]MBT6059593.1 HlyC/CorC family transporter [Anaerolineae bacterium]
MESTIGADLLRLVAVIILVLMNGFFVAAEFALVSVRGTRIKELVARGNSAAKWAAKALEHPDQVIAATQLGITLASLGLGWIGEPALSHLLQPLIERLPGNLQSGASHSIAVGLSFSIITFLHVVVGELAPKSIALQNPEATSLWVARPTLWTEWFFKPFIWALNGTGNALLKMVGVNPADAHELAHSVEELKMIVTASAEEGVMAAEEQEMLHAIFDFGELLVRQVMIPRTEISAFEADIYLKEAIEIAIHSAFTKFPIYDDDLDNIIGIVHIKDLLRAEHDPKRRNCKIRELAREAYFVPEPVPVRSVLQHFRVQRKHIGIVVDEFGGTAGLVTLEDLMEEIVGEVSDPFDNTQPEIQKRSDGSVVIDGLALIEEVNKELNLSLQDRNYDTIAGFVMGELNRIPEEGDTVKKDGICLQVEEMDGMRIARLILKKAK